MDIVEPCANLTDIFDNEVGRVVLFKFFTVFEGIMKLSKRHGTRIEPAVEDFFDAPKMLGMSGACRLFCWHDLSVLDTGIKFNLVDPRAVVIVERFAGIFFEFGIGADNNDSARVGFPDWHGGRPKTVAREIPVGSLFDVFGEPAVF